jgi:hypothetical protein
MRVFFSALSLLTLALLDLSLVLPHTGGIRRHNVAALP